MNRTLKGIVLFTALLLPVLIFLFLKVFGRNEFDIPVYYHSEVRNKMPCGNISLPYTVSLSTLGIDKENPTFHSIYQVLDSMDDYQLKQIMRVKDRLEGEKVTINSFVVRDSLTNLGAIKSKYQVNGIWRINLLEEDSLRKIRDCRLMTSRDSSLVLVDSDRRIRGYYDTNNPKDVDRLVLETKILMYGNKYE